ncbi:MAG: purine-nucleoside phosphorylase [Bacteroidetes bacterium]|nr:purine-nucleoside phosphorylase [Bacteroidota bacterium]
MFDAIQASASFIKEKTHASPKIGIVLGSGLSGILDIITIHNEIDYRDIPGFSTSTVEGHSGKLISGTLHGKDVVVMSGRQHYYEGYTLQEITFPIRVMRSLGVETLFLSNAAGGMNPNFKIGDIMIINDHINLFPEHPLRGKNDDRIGPRFPDMSEPYNHALIKLAMQSASAINIQVQTGVYIGLQGPTFETPAEYKWLRTIGGDAVGMSTVPECIVAVHCGMKVFATSIITDLGLIGHVEKISHDEVLAAANAAAPKLASLVSAIISRI